jgi:hypothetical protein
VPATANVVLERLSARGYRKDRIHELLLLLLDELLLELLDELLLELLDELLLELLDELLLELMLELFDELLDELPAEAVPAPTVIAMPIAPAPATTRVHVLVLGTAMVHLMFIGNPVVVGQAPPHSVPTMTQG